MSFKPHYEYISFINQLLDGRLLIFNDGWIFHVYDVSTFENIKSIRTGHIRISSFIQLQDGRIFTGNENGKLTERSLVNFKIINSIKAYSNKDKWKNSLNLLFQLQDRRLVSSISNLIQVWSISTF